MPPNERFERLQALFEAASELPERARPDFVREHAGDDPALAAELLRLLANASGPPTIDLAIPMTLPATTPSALAPLPRRFGDYRLLRQIAAGGMGVVYEAENVASGERVALKQIRVEVATPEVRSRFEREARLGATIDSPHCVFVRTAGVIDEVPYLTMELLPGETLESLVTDRGPLAPADALGHALDICAGVRALHDADVLHRDLKPSNCLLTAEGRVKVGDLGVSRSLTARHTDLTQTGQMLGTPVFAAPEQLRGDPVDERADVYGICATLYFLLSGRTPFAGDSYEQVIARVMTATPAPLDNAPAGLVAVVERGLAKDPDARPSSVRQLEHLLTASLPSRRTRATALERSIAAVADFGLLFGIALLAHLTAYPGFDLFGLSWHATLAGDPTWLVVLLLAAAYFTITDSRSGGSPGKRLVGLEVVDRYAGGRIDVARAGLRALIFVLVFSSYEFLASPVLQLLLPLADDLGRTWAQALAFPVVTATCYLTPVLLLFSPTRRRTGARGMHDLLARSDVVRRVPMPAEVRQPWAIELEGMRGLRVELDAYLGRHVMVVAPASLRGDDSDPNVIAHVVRDGHPFALATIPRGEAWQSWIAREDVPWSESRRVLLRLAEMQDRRPFDTEQLVIGPGGHVRCLPPPGDPAVATPTRFDLRELATRVIRTRPFAMPLQTRESITASADEPGLRRALMVDRGVAGTVSKKRRFATAAAGAALFFAATLVQYSLQMTQRDSHLHLLDTKAQALELLARPVEDAAQRDALESAFAAWRPQLRSRRGPTTAQRLATAQAEFVARAMELNQSIVARALDWRRALLLSVDYEPSQWLAWAWDQGSGKQQEQWRRLFRYTELVDPSQAPFLADPHRNRTMLFPLLAGLVACLLAFATRGQLPVRLGGLAIVDAHGQRPTRLRAALRTSLPFLAAWLAVVLAEWADWAFACGGVIAGALYMAVGLATIGYPLIAFRNPARMPMDALAGTRAVVR